MHCERIKNASLPFINVLVRKSFKRLPTTMEWGRFRKYARRMRELHEMGTPDPLPPKVISVLRPHAIDEPLLPNLGLLYLSGVTWFIPFISLLLSPRTTTIHLVFPPSDNFVMTIAATVTAFPTLCPNLQVISLRALPRDPLITAAVSKMLLATNRNTLQKFLVDSPLTHEANEVILKLSTLCSLSVVIDRETSLSSMSLPNLTEVEITSDEGDWPRLFHGATLGRLDFVAFSFSPQSKEIGDFLQAFERVALTSSAQNTLSVFRLSTPPSWNLNFSRLLPFTQLVDLKVESPCKDGCSSKVDDDMIIDISRAMPKLRELTLGDEPCGDSTTGVTAKGLMALALHCPDLRYLCIHFQVASLSVSPTSPGVIHNAEPTTPWTSSGLTILKAGEIPVPEESALTVALTLLRIFPRIDTIDFIDGGWEEVEGAIRLSRRIPNYSGKHHPLITC